MQDRYKYRVWDKNLKVMYPVWSLTPYGAVVDDLNIAKREISFNDCDVMQCTGLKDKNGKLIYEGDIVLSLATKSHTGVVCWDKEKAYFKINGKGIAYNALQTLHSENAFEVIGNIYENPELLEEQCANQLNKG